MNKWVRSVLRACRLYDPVVDVKHWLSGTEDEYVRFYSQFVNLGDLCFDIGANVGRRTEVLLRLQARVVVVEPQEDCMKRLQRKFATNERVTLIRGAVGETKGKAEIQLCDSHSLSSLSPAWIDSVRSSGRYAQCKWSRSVTVDVTTLDQLIDDHGSPAFVKLDVEGYEYEAIKGLSRPVGCICFEFTPEFIDATRRCVDHLAQLGAGRFNYCLEGTQASLELDRWAGAAEMQEVIDSLAAQKRAGDVYARFDL